MWFLGNVQVSSTTTRLSQNFNVGCIQLKPMYCVRYIDLLTLIQEI